MVDSGPLKEIPSGDLQKESAQRPPLPCTFRAYRVKPGEELPDEMRRKLDLFSQKQSALSDAAFTQVQDKGKDSEEVRKFMKITQAAYNTTMAENAFFQRLNPSASVSKGVSEGILVAVTDPAGDIIGFTTTIMEGEGAAKHPEETYVGVDAGDQYQGRGLGLRLVTLRNQIFFREGITSYDTRLWEGSIHMYERSGLTMQKLAQLPDEVSLGMPDTNFRVSLQEEQLNHLAENLGFKPTDNPLNAPVSITIP